MNSNFVLVWINSFGTSLQLVSHRSSLFGSQLDPPLVKIIYHMYKQNNQSHFRTMMSRQYNSNSGWLQCYILSLMNTDDRNTAVD